METFLQKNKVTLMVGIVCFGVGWIVGTYQEKHSQANAFVGQVMNQIQGNAQKIHEQREEMMKRFEKRPGSISDSWEEHKNAFEPKAGKG